MYPDRGPGLHERIVDLDCKFTGGGDDEDTYIVRFVFLFFLFNAGEDRKAERESFATGIVQYQYERMKIRRWERTSQSQQSQSHPYPPIVQATHMPGLASA